MLGRRGLALLGRDDYRDVFDFPVVNYYSKLGFDFAAEPFSILAAEYMDIYQPASFACPLRHQVLETLDGINARGVRQILLSATKREFLLEQTGHFALDGFFDAIIGLDDIEGKSKLEMALKWFADQDFDPQKSLLIGDTTHDYAVASALGCACLLMEGGHNSRQRLLETGATVVNGPEEIMEFLTNIQLFD